MLSEKEDVDLLEDMKKQVNHIIDLLDKAREDKEVFNNNDVDEAKRQAYGLAERLAVFIKRGERIFLYRRLL